MDWIQLIKDNFLSKSVSQKPHKMYVGIFWNSVVFWSSSAFSSASKESWWLVFWGHYLKLGNIKSGNQTVSIAVLFLSCAGVWLLSYIYNMLTHSVHCHWIKSITRSALVLLEVRNLVQKFIIEYCLQRDLQKGKGNIFSSFYSNVVCVHMYVCSWFSLFFCLPGFAVWKLPMQFSSS